MPTTAIEALRLVDKGRADYRTMEHADPFDATANYVFIFETDGYVDLGEVRPSGTVVIPGTLRGRPTDSPPVYENMRGERVH